MQIIISLIFLISTIAIGSPISKDEQKAIHLLFQNKAPFLSSSEKLKILNSLNLSLSTNQKKLIIKYGDVVFEDIDYTVIIDDLNKDGVPEIVIYYGNSIYSGMVGQTLVIFIKKQNGEYIKNFDVGSIIYEKLKSSSHGFADLQLGGPGFCRGVWRFDGQQYSHLCNIEDMKDGCSFHGHICTEGQLK